MTLATANAVAIALFDAASASRRECGNVARTFRQKTLPG